MVGSINRETIRETARALFHEIEGDDDDDGGGNISGGEDDQGEPPGGKLTRGHRASVSLNGTYSWVGDIRDNPQEVGLSESDVALIVKRGGKPIGGDISATAWWQFPSEDRAQAVFDELERDSESSEESDADASATQMMSRRTPKKDDDEALSPKRGSSATTSPSSRLAPITEEDRALQAAAKKAAAKKAAGGSKKSKEKPAKQPAKGKSKGKGKGKGRKPPPKGRAEGTKNKLLEAAGIQFTTSGRLIKRSIKEFLADRGFRVAKAALDYLYETQNIPAIRAVVYIARTRLYKDDRKNPGQLVARPVRLRKDGDPPENTIRLVDAVAAHAATHECKKWNKKLEKVRYHGYVEGRDALESETEAPYGKWRGPHKLKRAQVMKTGKDGKKHLVPRTYKTYRGREQRPEEERRQAREKRLKKRAEKGLPAPRTPAQMKALITALGEGGAGLTKKTKLRKERVQRARMLLENEGSASDSDSDSDSEYESVSEGDEE